VETFPSADYRLHPGFDQVERQPTLAAYAPPTAARSENKLIPIDFVAVNNNIEVTTASRAITAVVRAKA
jgi:hypothetical protein